MPKTLSYDYTGRTLDLEVFQTEAPPELFKRLSMTVVDDGITRVVSGVQKTVQRYLITFLTSKGSVKYKPDFGSIFMPAVMSGLLQSRSAVVQYFSFANVDVVAQMKAQDATNPDTPDDERIAGAYLVDYIIDTNSARLYLKIRIETMAGTDTVFLVPVK